MTPEIRALLNGVMSVAWRTGSIEKVSQTIEDIRRDAEDQGLSYLARSNCRFVLAQLAFVKMAARKVSLRRSGFTAEDGVNYVIRRVSGETFPHNANVAA